jgi:GcrA cell cycle regulator
MAWTEKMVEDLRQMWIEGLTANEIAKKLGVSKNSIVGKVHRLCLTARPSPIKKKGEVETEKEVTQIKEVIPVREIKPVKGAAASITSDAAGKVRLVDLDSHTCRWPLGDPRDEDFSFCGKKVRSGQTYCDEHAMMAYVKATKR